jgi:hypothetical protein
MNDGIEGMKAGPLPRGFKTGLAETVQAWLEAQRETADTEEARQAHDTLHELVHPVAEEYALGVDPDTFDMVMTRVERQFLTCLTGQVAYYLYTPEQLADLSVAERTNLAIMAMVGWQAYQDSVNRVFRLPQDKRGRPTYGSDQS